MKQLGTIKIYKRTQPGWLIWALLIMPFLYGMLFDLFHIPNAVKYVLDIIWILLALYLVLKVKESGSMHRTIRPFYLWILAFFLFTLCAYVANFQSVFYYLWGVRNNFRFYIAFLAFATFLSCRDVEAFFKIFDWLFWINAVVTVVQYFGLGLFGDWLGGIFGTEKGGNSYTNMFYVIMAVKTIVFYLNKREPLHSCVAKCMTLLVLAALAELKFFYVEFLLIIMLAILVSDFSWRKCFITVGGLAGTLLGVYLLTIIFPQSSDFFSLEAMLDIAASEKGYTSSGDINRLTAVPIISERFLKSTSQKLIGLGLGNCDYAGVDFLTTPFYQKYSYLNYAWFSISMNFLETGYLGMILFFGFFILVILCAAKLQKTAKANRTYCQIAIIMAVCCVAIAFYNVSLHTEAGYMAYFILSLPFLKRQAEQSIS